MESRSQVLGQSDTQGMTKVCRTEPCEILVANRTQKEYAGPVTRFPHKAIPALGVGLAEVVHDDAHRPGLPG